MIQAKWSTSWRYAIALVSVVAGSWGCASDLRDGLDMPPVNSDLDSGSDLVVHEADTDGAMKTRVDATDNEAWVYIDLESGKVVTPADPSDSADWDLAFRRFEIMLNGGESGIGDVAVVALTDTDFASVTSVPAGDYVTDSPDSDDDEDEDPQLVMSSGDYAWYNYDVTTHVLTPNGTIYVLRTVEGTHYKVEVLSYYDDSGISGIMSFYWAPL